MTEVLTHEPTPLHEPLTDERMGELLAGVGNHEGKALLLLAMIHNPDGREFATGYRLHSLIEELPGASDQYIGAETNQADWCGQSMVPIGLVAKVDYGEPMGFAVTKEGRELGGPLAALVLDFADRHNIPLSALFGETRSRTNRRSPMTVVKIMEEVLTGSGEITPERLEESIGVKSSDIHARLLRLSNAGLLTLNSWDPSEDQIEYQLGTESYVPGSSASSLRLLAMRYLQKNSRASVDELLEHCLAAMPEEEVGRHTPSEWSHKLHNSLQQLLKNSVLVRTKSQTARKLPYIELDGEQRQVWEELLNGLENFRMLNPSFIARLKESGRSFLRNPQKISAAIARANEASPYMQNGTEKNPVALVRSVLANARLSNREIVQEIARQTGRTLSREGVRKALKKLVELEEVATYEGKVKEYELLSTSIDSEQSPE